MTAPRYTRILKLARPMLRGQDVLQLQRRLRALGITQVGEPDGIFGPATNEGIRTFQSERSLTVDGIVGPVTWKSLFRDEQSTEAEEGLNLWALVTSLTELHCRFPELGGVKWALGQQGLSIDGAEPVGTRGEPETVRRVWGDFGTSIEHWSRVMEVPAELIIATICTESDGKPNACREEPRYVSDEATPERVSPGVMQTLISTARNTLDKPDIDRNWLFVPDNSIRAGTAYIATQFGRTNYDPPVVACAYNAGSVLANSSEANRWRMRQYPIDSAEHADRFVKWLNDAFRFFAGGEVQAPPVSFHRAFAQGRRAA